MLKGDKKKEYQRDYMRLKRSNKTGLTDGGVTWETIPLDEIKEILPSDIVADIIRISEYDRIRHSPISLGLRLRRAYKYKVWHDENFINGVHKDLLEVTK